MAEIIGIYILIVILLIAMIAIACLSHELAKEQKKVDAYEKIGDVNRYEEKLSCIDKEIEKKQATCNELSAKINAHIRDLALKDDVRSLKDCVALLTQQKAVLSEIVEEQSAEIESGVSIATELVLDRIGEIEIDPIQDEDSFIKREELRMQLSRQIKDMYSEEYFKNLYKDYEASKPVYHIMVRYSVVLTLYTDMLVNQKIGNPYKKGLDKSYAILDKCVRTVWNDFMSKTLIPYNPPYINMKREEIRCIYEIEQYKARRADERRALLQAQREELAAQREIERELKKALKDEKETQAKLEKRRLELAQAKSEVEIERLKMQIEKLEGAVVEAQQRNQRAMSLAQTQKAGHVYIISNIGSFGEGVYKIGMTRRLEPMERVVELGDASVPFPFDVHGMIWTEDAPALEAALHRAFQERRVNVVNGRKEFFRVSLDEIRAELKRLNIDAALIEHPLAAQYRDSMALAI